MTSDENKITEIKQSDPIRFDRSDWLSILAVIVSLIALGVSIYETGILKDQTSMMHAQQKASVWPYLEIKGNYLYGDRVEISFAFKNKGVGPAKIKKFKLTIDGRTFTNYNDLSDFFKDKLPESKDLSVSLSSLGGVLAAEEQIEVFHMNFENYPGAPDIIRAMEINYEICYCSIYDDCWYVRSGMESPTTGCQL